jgi:hypothetical protein
MSPNPPTAVLQNEVGRKPKHVTQGQDREAHRQIVVVNQFHFLHSDRSAFGGVTIWS